MIKMKHILSGLFFCVLLLSCHQKGNKQTATTREITDMAGRTIEIPVEIKTAFIDRHSVQLIYAFDAVDPVNRVFNYNESEKKYLKESFYENKPYALTDKVEEIIKLKPDVIFYSQLLTPETIESADHLQKVTGIPVVFMDVDFNNYRNVITFLGDVLNKTEKAKELTGFIECYVDSIPIRAQQIEPDKKVRVYYAEGMRGLNTDPSGSIHSLLIDLVGGVNIAQIDILEGKGMSSVSLEQIYTWNPDLILVWSGNFDSLDSYKYIKTSPLWAQLPAVKSNRVYQVPWKPFGWIDRPPGINRLIGIIWLAHLFYPDIYPFDMVSITKEFFQKFHHYHMTDEEAVEILNAQPVI